MYESLNDTERSEVLYSIKPTVKQYIRGIFIQGGFNSDIARLELQSYYLNRENDIFKQTFQIITKFAIIFLTAELFQTRNE